MWMRVPSRSLPEDILLRSVDRRLPAGFVEIDLVTDGLHAAWALIEAFSVLRDFLV
jgi:hypothetical protein